MNNTHVSVGDARTCHINNIHVSVGDARTCHINNIHVSVGDASTCHVRLCTLDDVEGPKAMFFKEADMDDMPIHSGALKLGGAGEMTLARNAMHGKLVWHLGSNHTRETVRPLESQTFVTRLTPLLPPRPWAQSSGEGGIVGWISLNVSASISGGASQVHFGPGDEYGRQATGLTLEEQEAAFRDQKSWVWRK
ncbi:hypothetical protein T484DRAFT_1855986, partial [Baffinella frigidus]